MTKSIQYHHDGKGTLKKHDGAPVKPWESVISAKHWDKLVETTTDTAIEKEKDAGKKLTLKETSLKATLKITKDEKDKPKEVKTK